MSDTERRLGDCTIDEVVDALKRIVATEGDTVYDRADHGCVYTNHDGSSSCLVGRLCDEVGVWRPVWGGAFNNDCVLTAFDIDEVSDLGVFLTRLQDHQDAGWPWGKSLSRAMIESGLG